MGENSGKLLARRVAEAFPRLSPGGQSSHFLAISTVGCPVFASVCTALP